MEEKKITSWQDLKEYRGNLKNRTDETTEETVIAVGLGTCGVAAGGDIINNALLDEIQKSGLKNISVVPTGCFGFCYAEPMVEVRSPNSPGIKYGPIDAEKAREIIRRHVVKNELLDDAIICQEVQIP